MTPLGLVVASFIANLLTSGGAKQKQVVGASKREFWLRVRMSSDGKTWRTVYDGKASGAEAGEFLSLAPLPRPFIAEHWWEKRDGKWRKQGTSRNWS